MPVKFNQYWTVEFDRGKEYEKFMIRKYIPGINKLGIKCFLISINRLCIYFCFRYSITTK